MLDEYVYQQQQVYMDSLYKYDEGLGKAVEGNFRERDWTYSSANREWTNDKINVTFRGANPNAGPSHQQTVASSGGGTMTPL